MPAEMERAVWRGEGGDWLPVPAGRLSGETLIVEGTLRVLIVTSVGLP